MPKRLAYLRQTGANTANDEAGGALQAVAEEGSGILDSVGSQRTPAALAHRSGNDDALDTSTSQACLSTCSLAL